MNIKMKFRKKIVLISWIVLIFNTMAACQKKEDPLVNQKFNSVNVSSTLRTEDELDTTVSPEADHIDVAFPFYELKVEGNIKGYLLGTIHAGKSEMYPFPLEIIQAINQSSVVVQEINTKGFDNTKELFYQKNSFPTGRELLAKMSDETRSIFEKRLGEVGLTEKFISDLNMGEITYEIERKQEKIGLSEAKMSYSFGVENIAQNKLTHSVEDMALETLEERYQVLYLPMKEMPLEEWVAEFSSLEDSNKELVETLKSYISGNMEANTFVYRDKYPQKFTRLVDSRNQVWLPKMTKLMEENRLPFFMVGVGHFYGEGGLLTILEGAGYSVEGVSFITN
ncbi:TraB/GumN family protein [Carnobacterium gallinarum]|uniref:TraB/GumN family protein n=1 Tax=Carnobacterium gallinarum TaxID=2749 RepID=UPI00147039FF|nr:TraB/GumN family protein [Carnobacterium gallinarum]